MTLGNDPLLASRTSIHALEAQPTRDLLEGVVGTYARLLLLVRSSEVQAASWTTGNTPVKGEDMGIRSRGMVTDPTPTITGDGRRLSLRARVLEAEGALVAAAKAMDHAERRLRRALDVHQGDGTPEEREAASAATETYTDLVASTWQPSFSSTSGDDRV